MILVHGLGGSGKSRLLKHFREIAERNVSSTASLPGKFRTVWLDWEDEQRDQPENYAGAEGPSLVTVLDAVQKAVVESFGQDSRAAHVFTNYRNGAACMPEYAARFASAIARGEQGGSSLTGADVAVLLKTSMSAGLFGIGHPSGMMGLTPEQLALSTQAAGRLSGAAARAITGKKTGEISTEEYDLVTDPRRELTRRVALALRTLAQDVPIVIFLDTGEVIGDNAWAWLRRVMRQTGPTVAWVVGARLESEAEAGPDSGVSKFVRDIGDEHLSLMSPTRFDDAMIADYLKSRLSDRDFNSDQIDAIAKFTRGLPLAVSFVAELLQDGQSVDYVCQQTHDGLPSSVVSGLARRYLIHAEQKTYDASDPRKEDVKKILGLALAFGDLRDDPRLLAALWNVPDPLPEFEDLARRHDFVLPVSRRLHDDVRDALRIDLLEPYRRDRAREINQLAVSALVGRLTELGNNQPTLDDQLDHQGFRAALLSIVWHNFWIDNQLGLDLFVNLIPIFAVLDRQTGIALASIASIFEDTLSETQQRVARLLTEPRRIPFIRGVANGRVVSSGNPTLMVKPDFSRDAMRLLSSSDAEPFIGTVGDRKIAMMILEARLQTSERNYRGAVTTLRQAVKRAKSTRMRYVINMESGLIASDLIWPGDDTVTRQAALGLEAAKIAIEADDRDGYSWNCYAVALLDLGRQAEALAAYDKALVIDPESFALHFNRGIALESLGRFEEALAAFDSAMLMDDEDFTVHCGRGDVLGALGRNTEALAAYDEALRIAPDEASIHFKQGIAFCSLGRFDEALGAFDRAVSIDADYVDAYDGRGSSLEMLGRLDEAVEAYDCAIVLDPESEDLLYHRGRILHALQRFDEALAAFELAIALNPDYVEAHDGRGYSLEMLGRLDEAVEAYDRAIVLDPESKDLLYHRGRILHALQRFDEALAGFDRAVSIDVDYVEAHDGRGHSLEMLGRLDEALEAYTCTAAHRPDDVDAHVNVGRVLYHSDRFEEALASFDKAISLDASNADAHVGRGQCLLQTGNLVEALEALDVAIMIASHDSQESEIWAGAILWHQGEIEQAEKRFALIAGRISDNSIFSIAEIEAIALCGIGQQDEAVQHLLAALPRRADTDGGQHPGLYRLLADPTLPGVNRLREILAQAE